MCLFNARSVCKDGKADVIADFIENEQVDIAFLTETWLNPLGHEPVEKSLTPSGYTLASFPRPSLGGGIAILYKDSLHPLLTFSQSLPFSHPSFEHVEEDYKKERKFSQGGSTLFNTQINVKGTA